MDNIPFANEVDKLSDIVVLGLPWLLQNIDKLIICLLILLSIIVFFFLRFFQRIDKWIISLLILLAIIVLQLSWLFRTEEIAANYFSNMPKEIIRFLSPIFPSIFTEIIGIIITLLFVDIILAIRERAEKAQRAEGGLRKAKKAFDRLIEQLRVMILVCLEDNQVQKTESSSNLFSKDFITHLSKLDFSKLSDDDSIIKKYDDFSDHLARIIFTYGFYFEAKHHEALDQLYDSEYFLHLKKLKDLPNDSDASRKFMNDNRHDEIRSEFFKRLEKAIEWHNRAAKDNLKIATP